MTKDGYVDSSRRVRSLQRQQDEPSVPLRINASTTTNKAASTPKKPKQEAENELPSVISISTNIEQKGKEHDKQMRLIEVRISRQTKFLVSSLHLGASNKI